MSSALQPDHLTEFIKASRSNEGNFEKLYQKLQELIDDPSASPDLKDRLQEAKTKAETYKALKEKDTSNWPEFEKFVTAFEKAVLEV